MGSTIIMTYETKNMQIATAKGYHFPGVKVTFMFNKALRVTALRKQCAQ